MRYYYKDDEILVEWNKYFRKWMVISPATKDGWEGVTYSATYSSERSPSAKQLAEKLKASWK